MTRLGDAVPYGSDGVTRRHQDLQRDVAMQAAARRAARTQIGDGGVLRVDGTLQVTGDLEVPAGSLSSAGAMTAGTTVTAGTNVVAGQDVSATRDVLAGRHVSATSDVTAGGTGSFSAGLTSIGAAGLDLSTLGGTRQAAWQHIATGRYGFAPSSVRKKTNIRDFDIPAAAFLAIAPKLFQYKAQIDIRDNPENPNYDPTHVVPFEPGVIAEELIAAGLEMFVVFGGDGEPQSVNYDYFAAIGFLVIARDFDTRLRALETPTA